MRYVFTFEQFLSESLLERSQSTDPESKDVMRISDIIKKSGGDDNKALTLARTMAKLIKDYYKAMRRAKAAEEAGREDLAEIFYNRAAAL
jgi:hypothetical protein